MLNIKTTQFNDKRGCWYFRHKNYNMGLFGTAQPLLELELDGTVSAPHKMGAKLGGALSQNELERLGLGHSTSLQS